MGISHVGTDTDTDTDTDTGTGNKAPKAQAQEGPQPDGSLPESCDGPVHFSRVLLVFAGHHRPLA